MGKTYKELKKKIEQLRFENSFLTSKVEKVLLENGIEINTIRSIVRGLYKPVSKKDTLF